MGSLRLPLGSEAEAPVAGWVRGATVGLVAAAVVVALTSWPAWARAAGAIALVAAAAVISQRLAARRRVPRGFIVVDDAGVRRLEEGREVPLVDWREPFGATVLGSLDRTAFLVAITSPRATRFVSARLADADDAANATTLIDRASSVADSDLRLDASALSAADAETLLAAIARRAPAALERAFLSDAAGEPVVLDRFELRVGARSIDLAKPLDWRASVFQELGAHAASLCQATWVRQGEAEVVLVAPMSDESAWSRGTDGPRELPSPLRAQAQSAVARDMRLMRASRSDPPPRELRRAIDHVFMLPLRRALDRAPRASRAPKPPSRHMPEGRA